MQLSVVFIVTSHSPATAACTRSGTLLTLLIQYSFKSSPAVVNNGIQKCPSGSHTTPGLARLGQAHPIGHRADKSRRRTRASHPPELPAQLQASSRCIEAKPTGQQVPHCALSSCVWAPAPESNASLDHSEQPWASPTLSAKTLSTGYKPKLNL